MHPELGRKIEYDVATRARDNRNLSKWWKLEGRAPETVNTMVCLTFRYNVPARLSNEVLDLRISRIDTA